MNFWTSLFALLSLLASAGVAGPVRRIQTLATRDFVPEHIIWQSNVNRTQNPMVPNIGAVKACQRITYYSGTPATGIRRSDCQMLASQIRSNHGYWEMWWWDRTSGCKTLASYGTCNVAISRFDGNTSSRQQASDVAIIGNSDIVDILDHVLSYGSSELVNSNNIAGEMGCKWYFANNTTMGFVVRNNNAVQDTDSP